MFLSVCLYVCDPIIGKNDWTDWVRFFETHLTSWKSFGQNKNVDFLILEISNDFIILALQWLKKLQDIWFFPSNNHVFSLYNVHPLISLNNQKVKAMFQWGEISFRHFSLNVFFLSKLSVCTLYTVQLTLYNA